MKMAGAWSEVELARDENRHELVLTGPDISTKVDKNGLDEHIFKLNGLNFLEISKTSMTTISPLLCNLSNLTDLSLHGNKLTTIPDTIGKLSKLKLLDVSRNVLQSLPVEIGQLQKLHTLNLNGNKLTELPDVSGLVQLHIVDISHNEITKLPDGIGDGKLELLAQLFVNGNHLEELQPGIGDLQSLKTLDISDNKLLVIPPEIGDCHKLKEFKYGGNKLKDRRFARMMEQCSTKAVLDYQRAILEKERKAGGKGKDKKKRKKGKGKDDDDMDEITKNFMKVLYFGVDSVQVSVSDNVLPVRQYIVCCIVKHLNLNKTKNMMKRFLNFQTRLHDTSCKKRQAATIATHDLKAVSGPLSYEAKSPPDMKLVPLGKMKETTADKLVDKLRKEADDFRKEKKRNTTSGIHQYLDLLNGHDVYPCMVDSKGVIVSFPPITNCDVTKVCRDTTDILVEVTSSTSLDVCKLIMTELLQGLLEMGLGCSKSPEPPVEGAEAAGADDHGAPLTSDQVLILEQVKVVDNTGALKVVYPSRVDLQSEAFRVERD